MILALAGGVGGAKLAFGLQSLLANDALLVAVNTGDDFDHYGLRICPDLDTVCYTLSDWANPETGWGQRDESWTFAGALRALGEDPWFNLGDKDLATHAFRTARLAAGHTLTEVTAELAGAMGVTCHIAPMTDDDVRTVVVTDEGELAFQHYFVRRRCEPVVSALRFEGADAARPSDTLIKTLQDPALEAIIICPSNPFLSVAPFLAMPGFDALLKDSAAPVVAVSPIVGGEAIKGPAAKLMSELGITPSASAVATHYGDLLDGFIIDNVDANLASDITAEVLVTDTVMRSNDDRVKLATEVLAFARQLGNGRS